MEAERAADARLAFERERRLHAHRRLVRDRETQTRAVRMLPVQPRESAEDAVMIRGRDAQAIVAHGDQAAAVRLLIEAEADPAYFRLRIRVLDRIADEVAQDEGDAGARHPH